MSSLRRYFSRSPVRPYPYAKVSAGRIFAIEKVVVAVVMVISGTTIATTATTTATTAATQTCYDVNAGREETSQTCGALIVVSYRNTET